MYQLFYYLMNLLKKIIIFLGGLTKRKKSSKIGSDETSPLIMETPTELNPVNFVRDWAIQKIELLHEADRHRNADALLAEFDEWINLPDGVDEIEYLSIEEDE